MKAWKIIVAGFLSFSMVLFSCTGNNIPVPSKLDRIRLVGTIGPMSIPLAYMKEHHRLASIANETTLEIWANPTQLQAIITGGQGDFISLPTNSAAIFYNKGVSLQLLDCSIWNILYLVTSDTTINSIKDLKNKKVVVPYQGAVPDALFQVILKQQGINSSSDIEIIYATDPVQGSQLLLSGKEKYVLLSEPAATSVILRGQSSSSSFTRALNMQTEYAKSVAGGTPIAGTVALGPIKNRPDVIKTFVSEYRKAVQWMLKNPVAAGEIGARILAEQGFTSEVLTQSMQNINWDFVLAASAQPDIEKFFNALMQVSPNFIGGKLPDDGFYYKE